MEKIETKRTIGHDEAVEIASRFIGGHFKNLDKDGERIHARITIPADTERDDDILLLSYIEQQSAINAELLAALEEADAMMERAAPKDAWEVLCGVGDVVGSAIAKSADIPSTHLTPD